jgi:hypothetical protein
MLGDQSSAARTRYVGVGTLSRAPHDDGRVKPAFDPFIFRHDNKQFEILVVVDMFTRIHCTSRHEAPFSKKVALPSTCAACNACNYQLDQTEK